jgi:hypothetical protein
MQQLDIEISRYEEKLLHAVSRNLPEAVIQQYNHFLEMKQTEKRAQSKQVRYH